MASTESKFLLLPEEIVQQVLYNVTAEDAAAFRAVNKKFSIITQNSLLWETYCRRKYRFWHPRHNVPRRRVKAMTTTTDWRALYLKRTHCDRALRSAFKKIIQTPQNRIANMEIFLKFGYDAKDLLLEWANDKKWLSRRYWASAILGSIHRSIALAEWMSLMDPRPPKSHFHTLERSLSCFDMFTLDNSDMGDLADITTEMDTVAAQMIADHPEIWQMPTRKRSTTVASFMRSHHFRGVQNERDYHNLRNNFLGLALTNPKHESLPLVSASLFCALAARVGIHCRPIRFPGHVYAVVTGSRTPGDESGSPETVDWLFDNYMYIDVFRTEDEVPLSDLHTLLIEMGAERTSLPYFLQAATDRELVLRTCQNIMRSIQKLHNAGPRPHPDYPGRSRPPLWATISPDMDSAFYAVLWATLLLGNESRGGGPHSEHVAITTRRRHYFPFLAEHFRYHHPWDVSLVEQFVTPLICNLPEYEVLIEAIEEVRMEDAAPVRPVRRSALPRGEEVEYFVGQVFYHRRYRYMAVIKGWDVACQAGEEWIAQMEVDRLEGGRGQAFYHVLVEDKSDRYVAAENVELTDDAPSGALMKIAGRYFHYYDEEARRFVSNIKEEYPHD